MVTGDNPLFPYRSSSYITRFFERCGFAYVHDGSTRKWWTKELLSELNLGASDQHDLPSADLLRVMSELFATKPQKALVLGKSLLRLPLPVPNAPPVSLPNSPALLRSNRAKHVLPLTEYFPFRVQDPNCALSGDAYPCRSLFRPTRATSGGIG